MSGPQSASKTDSTAGPIDLSACPPFRLGDLEVCPPTREVRGVDGAARVIEPRVMQVLVALTQAAGRVVSRDTLIARCWGRRVVGDDAINRAVFKARQIAALGSPGAFAIEAIPRVGYRLLHPQSSDAAPAPMAAPPTAVRTGEASAIPHRADPVRSGGGDVRRARLGPGRTRALVTASILTLALLAAAVVFLNSGLPASPAKADRPQTVAVQGFEAEAQTPAARDLARSLNARVADALSEYDVTVEGMNGGPAKAAQTADFLVGGHVEEKDHKLVVRTELTEPREGVLVYAFDLAQDSSGPKDVARAIANHIALSLDPTKFTNDLEGKLTAVDFTLIARANDAIDRWDLSDILEQTQRLAGRHPRDGDLQASTAISAFFNAQASAAAEKPRLLRLFHRSIEQATRLSPKSALLFVAKSLLTSDPMSLPVDERLLRTALRLDPRQHVAVNGLGELMLTVGRTGEGVALIKRSIQLDPMSRVVVDEGLQDLVKGGRAAESFDLLRRYVQIWPADNETLMTEYVQTHLLGGDPLPMVGFDRVNPDLLKSMGFSATLAATIGRALQTRNPVAVRQMNAECFENHGHSVGRFQDVDCLFAMTRLGRMDEAFRFAAIVYPDDRTLYPPQSDSWITPPLWPDTAWLFSPVMAPFRDDNRFWEVALRTGLINYWRTTGAWPDFCMSQISKCRYLAAAVAGGSVHRSARLADIIPIPALLVSDMFP